ncbi:MAG: sulfatase, partial [Planctomycetota bacterium]
MRISPCPTVLGMIFLETVVFVGALAGYCEAAPRSRPNIVFLLTDDQRWDTLGCTGNEIIRT